MALLNVTENNQWAHVRMNRPDVRNAFNPQMLEELTKTFQSFDRRKDLRGVLLSGEGKAFSAGADLSWMRDMVHYSYEQNREDSLKLFATFEALMRCPLPVLGCVHGAVYGGALGLMACCDQVVAEEGTVFSFSEVRLGIAPAVISSFILRKANPGVIRPLMISGQPFDAACAERAGLVHKVVAKGAGLAELETMSVAWSEAGPDAVRETKKLLNDLPDLTWEQQRDRATRLIAERRVSSEGQEGLKSFLEKRSPAWRDK